jgi:hypothetical protein
MLGTTVLGAVAGATLADTPAYAAEAQDRPGVTSGGTTPPPTAVLAPQPWKHAGPTLFLAFQMSDGSNFPSDFDAATCTYGLLSSSGGFTSYTTTPWTWDKSKSDSSQAGKPSVRIAFATQDVTGQDWYKNKQPSDLLAVQVSITTHTGVTYPAINIPVTPVVCDPCV